MRDLSIIGLVVVAAIGLGILLFFFEPSSLRSQVDQVFVSNGSVPITVLAQGTKAVAIQDRTNYRIQNAHDLMALWELVYGYNDTPATPTVDFTKNEVLAVFDGSHATNGYTISIVSVTDNTGKRLVVVSHDAPHSSCTLTKTPTSPFEIVLVPKTTLAISHQDQMGTAPCP
jgi:hypothetical protein